jgi:hypothetical protein
MEITFEIRTKVKRAGGERLRKAVIAALKENTVRRIRDVNDPLLVEVRSAAIDALPKTASKERVRALRTEIVKRLGPVGLGWVYPSSAG